MIPVRPVNREQQTRDQPIAKIITEPIPTSRRINVNDVKQGQEQPAQTGQFVIRLFAEGGQKGERQEEMDADHGEKLQPQRDPQLLFKWMICCSIKYESYNEWTGILPQP